MNNSSIRHVLVILLLVTCFSVTPCLAQRSLMHTLYETGLKAYRKGNYRESLRLFRQCEDLSKTTKLTAQEEAGLLYSVAETLRSTGQYKEAEPGFKRALIATDALPPKQRIYFYLFNSMALLYQGQGRFAEAESFWKQCEGLGRKGDPRQLYPVNNLAHHYFIWGKLPEEGVYVEKATRLASHAPKTLADPYFELNLAQYEERKGLYQDAERDYKKALASCTALVGADHPYVGLIQTEYAELLRKQSRYAEAEESLHAAQKVFEGQYSSEHPDIAETMVRLGRVLCEEGRYSQARALVQNALQTEEIVFGSGDNLFVSRARQCLGNISRQEGHYQEALATLKEVVATKQRILGRENIEVAIAIRELALVLEDEANYKEAEAFLTSSLAIIESQTGIDHPERAAAANALAHAYLRDEQVLLAEPLLKKALELSERVLGANNAVTADGARDLGELYLKQKSFANAENYLQKSLSLDEKLYGPDAPRVASDLIGLASAYGAEGQSEKAAPLLNRAAAIKNVLPGGKADSAEPQAPVSTGEDRPVTDKWALVVGISNFKDSSINLKFAAKDATDFKNFLINTEKFRPDHVKLLTDEDANRESIIGLLGDKWLASRVKADDLVLVYISSHGSSAANEAGGTNFLVAHDTNKNSLLATGIPLQWLTNIVTEQVRSDRVILILDVCHSGAAGEGQKALVRTDGVDPTALKVGKGQMIICSSRADQVSWESKNYENSVFTRRLIEALQSNKGQTTMLDAYNRLKILVESEVLRDRGNLQTPLLLNKNWVGKDAVLGVEAGNK